MVEAVRRRLYPDGRESCPAIVSGSMWIRPTPRRRSRRSAGAALLALGALVLLAGCGDDAAPIEPIQATTTPDAGVSTPVSTEEFVAAADPRCADTLAAIAGLESGSSAGSLTLLASQERQLTEALMAELEALDPPADSAITDFLRALADQVNILKELEAAAESDDTVTFEALGGELAQAKADALAAATDAGFEDCGQDGESVEPPSTGSPTAPPTGGTPAPAPAPVPTPTPEPVPVAPADPADGAVDPSAPADPAPVDDTGSSGGIGPG